MIKILLFLMLVSTGLGKPFVGNPNPAKIEHEIRQFANANCILDEDGYKIYKKLVQLEGINGALNLMRKANGVILTQKGAALVIDPDGYSFTFDQKPLYYEINPYK